MYYLLIMFWEVCWSSKIEASTMWRGFNGSKWYWKARVAKKHMLMSLYSMVLKRLSVFVSLQMFSILLAKSTIETGKLLSTEYLLAFFCTSVINSFPVLVLRKKIFHFLNTWETLKILWQRNFKLKLFQRAWWERSVQHYHRSILILSQHQKSFCRLNKNQYSFVRLSFCFIDRFHEYFHGLY